MENACITFCTHNAVKGAFLQRSISNGREISLNFTTKSTNYCNLSVSGLVSTTENACTTFWTNNAVKRAFKRRSISNGRAISLNFRQNWRIIAVCVYLGWFRRRTTCALGSPSITQCKVRLIVEVSQTGEKYRLILLQNQRIIAICVYLGLYQHWRTGMHYVLNV